MVDVMFEFDGMTHEQILARAAERQARREAEQAAEDALTDVERAALPYLRMTPAEYLKRKQERTNDGD